MMEHRIIEIDADETVTVLFTGTLTEVNREFEEYFGVRFYDGIELNLAKYYLEDETDIINAEGE